MELSIALEEIVVLLQWQYPALPHELWLAIVRLRLSFLPQNHPVFLHLIASVKRVWLSHFHCLDLRANLVLFLPDPRIQLKKAVLGHIARRYATHCWEGHGSAGIEVRFTGRARDEQRMLQRAQNVLLGDPLRDYVYRRSNTFVAPVGLLIQMPSVSLPPGLEQLPRPLNTCYCTTCYPTLESNAWWRHYVGQPSQHFPTVASLWSAKDDKHA